MAAAAKTKRKKQEPAAAAEEVAIPSADYRKVVERAQLISVRMIREVFDLDPGFFASDEPQLQYGRDVVGFEISEGKFTAVFEWWLEARHGETVVLSHRARWLAAYDGVEDCDESAAFEFAQRVGSLSTYAYFRSNVAQTTWAAGIQLPPLPLVRGADFPLVSLTDFNSLAEEDDAPVSREPRTRRRAK